MRGGGSAEVPTTPAPDAVTAVDPAARTLDVELAGRRVRLDAGYLDTAARHGSALQHAYAITGHVAQGLAGWVVANRVLPRP